MRITLAQAQADIAFLIARSNSAGSISFGGPRWTGMSSNALVRFAFGGEHDVMPSDRADYAACIRTVYRLPGHRKTPAVIKALWRPKAAYLDNYPEDRCALDRNARHRAWQAECERKWAQRAKRRAAARRRAA